MAVGKGSTMPNNDSIGSAGSPGSKDQSRSGLKNGKKSNDESGDKAGSMSLKDLLSADSSDVETTESTKVVLQGKRGRPKIVKEEPKNGGDLEPGASWSFRELLGSFRARENENDVALNSSPSPGKKPRIGSMESNTGSPLKQGTSPLAQVSPLSQGSPMPQGSPLVKRLLTPSTTFARIREDKEEKSRLTPTPEELKLKDGIKLPMVGQVRWEDLKQQAVTWLKSPRNLAFLAWLIAVIVSGAILFMVMVGMLNKALPNKSDRNRWFEISNQIINGLFTLMCLILHPMRVLHLHYLVRYNPNDIIKLRKTYCKDGLRKPNEWAHIIVVVLLLHLNCFAQYALAGLNWGYRRDKRPASGVGVTLFFAIGAPAAAGIYSTLSPLGRDYFADSGDEAAKVEPGVDDPFDKMERAESAGHSSNHPALFKLHNKKYKLLEKRKSFACREGRPVQNPLWEGGLLDCCEEPTISILTTLCFPCVMGYNYERLGFGNRYVHIATFLLLAGAPFLIFNLAAINLDNGVVRTSLGVAGAVLCVFSLLYGGFWRIKIRERYKLPAHAWCCKQPNLSDCLQWLFCSFCSLCQEVRTAEAYDVRNDRLFVRYNAKVDTPGGSSPDSGLQRGNSMVAPGPVSPIQPLPGSPMVPIKDRDLLPGELTLWQLQNMKTVGSTILVPPPDQTVDRPVDRTH